MFRIHALAALLVFVPVCLTGATLEDSMIAAHNQYREEVHVAPLRWSEQLADRAQRWAETLIEQNAWGHQHGNFGENLFEISGGLTNAAHVVKAWVSERADYDYVTNRCRGMCGHYTQVVWRDTRRVGCGVARKPGREVWVCDYYPPGNVIGEKPY